MLVVIVSDEEHFVLLDTHSGLYKFGSCKIFSGVVGNVARIFGGNNTIAVIFTGMAVLAVLFLM